MNNQKKHVLISTFADPAASPRPRRMIERALNTNFDVSLFCLPPTSKFETSKVYPIHSNPSRWKWRRKFAAFIIGLGYYLFRTQSSRENLILLSYGLASHAQPFQGRKYDLIIVADLFLLPYCLKHARGVPLILDAREFYPRQREGDFIFDLLERPVRDWVCKTYLPACSKIFTVSDGLSEAYKSHYGVSAEVLRSTPPYIEKFKQSARTDTATIRMVHLGVANPNRKIENMIEIFRQLKPGFTFDLYLAGNKAYISRLKQLATGIPNLNICPPTKPDAIIPTLQNYDLGFYYLEPKGFNLKHSLPNKFFEFVQARLAVAIGPSPEMEKLVKKYECGFVAETFELNSMIQTLNALDRNAIQSAKQGSDRAASLLCAEKEWTKVDNVLRELTL